MLGAVRERRLTIEGEKRKNSKGGERERSRSPYPPVGKPATKAGQWISYQHKLAYVTMILPKEDPNDAKEATMCRIIYPAVNDVCAWEEPAGPVKLSRCKITALPKREYRNNLRKAVLKLKLKVRNAEKSGEMEKETEGGRRSLMIRVSDEGVPSPLKQLAPKMSEDGVEFDEQAQKEAEKKREEEAAAKLAALKIRKSRGRKSSPKTEEEAPTEQETAPVEEKVHF